MLSSTIVKYTVIAMGVFGILWIVSGYNKLVTAEENMENAWRQVETQYQRRVDLVPNLVSTVRGEASFERETLTAVTEARTRWLQAAASDQREGQLLAAEQMDSALSRLLVTVEAYPQLRATQAFENLMVQLEGTENRIAVARRDFNETVRLYNVSVRRAPGNLVASLFGFESQTGFQSSEGADRVPTVRFDDE